jgi:hypothetical protein
MASLVRNFHRVLDNRLEDVIDFHSVKLVLPAQVPGDSPDTVGIAFEQMETLAGIFSAAARLPI